MGGMIFWRLTIVSRQKDCKFNHMLILCLGSFLNIAFHFLIVYNFKCNYDTCFKKWCLFSPSEFTREVNWDFLASELGHLTFSLSWNWEIISFLSNNYKPILGVGKGKNFRNANLTNTHKFNRHDIIGMIWISRRAWDLQPTCTVWQQSQCVFYWMALSLQCILSIALYFFFYRSWLALLQVRMEASTFRNFEGNPPKINSTLLKISKCCTLSKSSSEVQLSIDILLLTV